MALFLTLLPYLLLTASLILFLGLLHGLNQTVRKLRGRVGKCEARIQAEMAQFVNAMAAMKLRIEELEAEPQSIGIPNAGGNGLNTTLRSKVLKMHRLGQPADRIADTLNVPKGEVDLLVKVHQVVMRPYEGAGMASSEAAQKNI